ncbi:Hsp20/alpha crystallin family protein [Bacillus pumilus]|uniref:Hsp20/alpha crystallin family protein n=1 Tax=Bacillus pumilus TaxID=1408 RepID=UPI001C21F4B6|nr:Hsp20/alpha crystallin family protein [Bacillus pumilus]MBU8696964.1 Hsp20/alpha crystallin family protein [Bacillus pumilus]
MDFEKMKQWMVIAQQMHGDDFWKMIFDDEQRSPFMANGPSPFTFTQQDQRGPDASFPPIDMVETATEIQYLIYLPGYRKEDVQVLSYGEYLVVKGQRFSFFNEQDFRQKQGKYGPFEKKIRLPEMILGQMNAAFKDGVLYIRLQKDEGKATAIIIDDEY